MRGLRRAQSIDNLLWYGSVRYGLARCSAGREGKGYNILMYRYAEYVVILRNELQARWTEYSIVLGKTP